MKPIKRSDLLMPLLLTLAMLFLTSPATADVNDYDPVTGEPKCMNCHTPDRKYSIDYTREGSCTQCHGAGLSDEYIEMDQRFRSEDASGKDHSSWVMAKADISTTPEAKSGKSPEGMVLVPAGEFTMGTNEWWPKSQPAHIRDLPAFYIDKYEVTNRDYLPFVRATGYRTPSHWLGGVPPADRLNHPVTFVNWFDADNYCSWAGKRLPTEPEWEKAARGTDQRTFPWGDKFDKDKGNTPQYGRGDTMPIGSFENGKSPYGLYDMAGNAFEWTYDWFIQYPGNKHPDENYGEIYKSVRGGSWFDCTFYKCGISAPSYNRIFFNPYTKNNNFGFRCAK